MKNPRFFVVLLSLVALAMASENAAGPYPEHGKVVAVRTTQTTDVKRIYTDSYGRTYGGGTYHFMLFVYKIETPDRIYEFTGSRHQDFQAGDRIQFRVNKGKAFMPSANNGRKEAWYTITGEVLPQR